MYIRTGLPEFDDLLIKALGFLEHDILETVIDGERVSGFRSPDAKSIWIRDHSDMMRLGKYIGTDIKSTVNQFAATQASNGRIFDYFTTFPEKLPCEKENWTKYVRVPVEADVEFRFIKAAFLAWQATGDDTWMLELLPSLERALDYVFSSPQRVDQETGLVKRAYTIDTWDFAYTAGKHEWLQFQINDDTFWGFFHGDNSGYYEALSILALLHDYFKPSSLPGMSAASGPLAPKGRWHHAEISKRREEIRSRVNEVCWNGQFYTHFVKLTPVDIPGVDERLQLSMANPMSINRGIATHEMAVSVIQEYRRRKETTRSFAEWFSIDPPFPDGIFGDEKLVGGAYINGGIFPLAGAELAMAALNHGFEEYGVSILRQYYRLIAEKNETYLWYFPDGTHATVETSTSPEAMPTDGWGSSAMAWALIEGLAGIEDRLKRFEKVRLSPRWQAAGVEHAEVGVGYPVADYQNIKDNFDGDGTPEAGLPEAGVRYRYVHTCQVLEIKLHCHAEVDFHVLISADATVSQVELNGSFVDHETERIEQSQYVNFSARINHQADIRIIFTG